MLAYLGIAWDCNIDESQRRVGVGESDDRNINVGSLVDGLMILHGVCHNEQPRLTERSLTKEK